MGAIGVEMAIENTIDRGVERGRGAETDIRRVTPAAIDVDPFGPVFACR